MTFLLQIHTIATQNKRNAIDVNDLSKSSYMKEKILVKYCNGDKEWLEVEMELQNNN